MRFETDAFIIHTRPYKETSLIVSFFTKEYGNVSAIAKGAKGKKSKFSGNLEPFRLMNIGFGGKSNLKSLFFSDSLETYDDFKVKKNLYSAFYINELIYSLLPPNERELIIFNQYHSSIKKLKKNDNTEEILREFEYLFLKEIGYQIDFENEYSSGDAIESNSFYEFAPQSGFKRAEKGFLGKDLQEIARKEYNPINLKTFKAINRKSFEYYFEELNINSRGFFK